MSNPLESVVETLKRAEPRPEAVGHAVAALRRPHAPRLVPLAVGVAALSAFVLWPHGRASMAWAQIAAQGVPSRYHEWHEAKGRRGMETWVDRDQGAYRMRSNANSVVEGFDFIESPRGVYQLLNGVATFTHKRQGPSGDVPLTAPGEVRARTDITMLKSHRFRQISVDRGVETRVGRADRYVLKRVPTEREKRFVADAKAYFDNPLIAYVQPETGRILGYDERYLEGPGQATIEYPESFPAGTFAIPPHGGPKPYDLDAIDSRLRARLARPIAILRAGGQTARLRLVVQDARNALWVVWEGVKPNGDLRVKERATVLGLHNHDVFGTMTLTNKDRLHRTPFGGHAIQLDTRVDRVDLRVPVFVAGEARSRLAGFATVRNVAVERVPYVRTVFPALGLKGRVY